MPTFCVCHFVDDPEQLARAEEYDIILGDQDDEIIEGQIQLGYFQVATEVQQSAGEANDIMNQYGTQHGDQFLLTDAGDHAAVEFSGQHRRLWDYRHPNWNVYFLSACQRIINRYGGIFLDNCTGSWEKQVQYGGEEMASALQAALLDLRRDNPDALIAANSAENWSGLNGEMLEGRDDFDELIPVSGQVVPNLNMMVYLTEDPYNDPMIQVNKDIAESYGAMFYACTDYQHITKIEAKRND